MEKETIYEFMERNSRVITLKGKGMGKGNK